MAAGGRARLAWTVAAIAMTAKPQTVPATKPVSSTASALSPKPTGSTIASRIRSHVAVPARKPTPKNVADDTPFSA
ncbi:MAG: hypothetical protein AB7P02_00720 [Alphaproteobacteria bacterium]